MEHKRVKDLIIVKVGIVTITKDLNYGNRLQNYALYKFLQKFSIQGDTILDLHQCWHVEFDIIKYFKNEKTVKNCVKNYIAYYLNYNNRRTKINQELQRQPYFMRFNKLIPFSEFTVDYDKVPKQLKDAYDYFIVGSDQVWNPHFKCSDFEFLTFAPQYKRIAYSASFGISKVPEILKEQYVSWINGMEHISVRELAGAEIIKQLTGRDVPVNVDPTLLLTKEEWLEIAEKPSWYLGEKFILTYFLGEIPKNVTQEIQRVARKENLKIINLLNPNNMEWYCIGPSEFIYLINSSSIMYTDSFHGTVFSILMQIPFIICERVQQNLVNMNSRIDTLLNMFQFQERRGTLDNNYQVNNLMQMNFSKIDQVLTFERKRSEEYLKRALKI